MRDREAMNGKNRIRGSGLVNAFCEGFLQDPEGALSPAIGAIAAATRASPYWLRVAGPDPCESWGSSVS